MQYQDWNEVIIRKKTAKPKSNEDAQRIATKEGVEVNTVKKYGAGQNKPKSDINMKNLADAEDIVAPSTVPKGLSIRIQQARQSKGWTQKELATKINEKADVVRDYESGKAIPSNQILGKLERVLGVKLRGQSSQA